MTRLIYIERETESQGKTGKALEKSGLRTAATVKEASEIVPWESRQGESVEDNSRRQQQKTAAIKSRELDGNKLLIYVKSQPCRCSGCRVID